MAELLLELFSEEIPARMQRAAAEELKQRVTGKLQEQAIPFSHAASYVSPRRLVLHAEGIPEVLPDTVVEKKGPKVGAPQAAVEGFAGSAGVSVEQLEVRSTDKGDFYFSTVHQKGQLTSELLLAVLKETLAEFSWPKSMRWGAHSSRWVRPLQGIVCLFDGKVIPLEYNNIRAGRVSYGHRFLGNEAFDVHYFADYQQSLRQRKVILDTEERKQLIEKEAGRLAASLGYSVKPDAGLLEEVAGLVEWPYVLVGSIDARFMEVPKEALSTAMRSHQKYFSMLTDNGALAPHFIVVANMQPQDSGAVIVAGNERVLRARLSDAKFFWDQDRKKTLEARAEGLDKITFHNKLGTIADKVARMEILAKFISVWVPHANLKLVSRASLLCKSDLLSEMVMEFPELQGIMGAYYAQHDGEDSEVAASIGDHYRPLGPSDAVPTRPVSIAVALADKIDTLTGLFAADEKPTGSKDPFALRRAALGIIRIILENNLSIPLRLLFEKSLSLYPTPLLKSATEKTRAKHQRLIDEFLEFFADRLKASLKSQSVRHDLITAVFDGGNEDDLLRLVNRVMALQQFLETENGRSLYAAYKRASNIVILEEKKDKASYRKEPLEGKLIQREEQELFNCLERVKPDITAAMKEDRFQDALALLSELRAPIDQFFEKVTVNCDNPEIRRNRLMILSQIRGLLDGLANFALIEG
jgi:glycyl-tRNA synthetase beta chain